MNWFIFQCVRVFFNDLPEFKLQNLVDPTNPCSVQLLRSLFRFYSLLLQFILFFYGWPCICITRWPVIWADVLFKLPELVRLPPSSFDLRVGWGTQSNSLSFHPSLGFYSLWCSWGAHHGAGLSPVSRVCVDSWWNLLLFSFPGLSSPTPRSILGWSFPWPCCDCNLSLTKRYWCPICFL